MPSGTSPSLATGGLSSEEGAVQGNMSEAAQVLSSLCGVGAVVAVPQTVRSSCQVDIVHYHAHNLRVFFLNDRTWRHSPKSHQSILLYSESLTGG